MCSTAPMLEPIFIKLPRPSAQSLCWPHWGGQKLASQARTRILLWYILLLGCFVAAAMPLMRYLIISQVNLRVREDLAKDLAAFEGLLDRDPETLDRFGLDGEHSEAESFLLPPITAATLKQVFQLYVTRRIPEDDTIFLAFLGSDLFLSSVKARPQLLQPGSDLFRYFLSQTQLTEGEYKTNDPAVGSILYIVRPIQVDGKMLGTFVTLHLNAGERQEAFDALNVMFQGMLFVLLLALMVAWWMAGRVLAPLRAFSETARTISETDLTQRIAIRGEGELADLAHTFNDMMDRVETAFAIQRDFVNDAGHELRTPITIIRGYLEVMDQDPQEQKKILAIVFNELDRMSRFVQDLLLLAKAQRLDFVRFDLINLQAFTEDLFTKAKVLGDRTWQLEAIADGQLVGDRQRITEAVMNLVQNAIEHTTPSDTITFGSTLDKDCVHFWVADTGIGIAPQDQQYIFERFARATQNRRRSEGAGLGLAIVRAIVEAHGGEIQLSSQLGQGSQFTLVFPLDPPREVAFYETHPHCGR